MMILELRLRTSFKRSSGNPGEIKFQEPIIGVMAVYESQEIALASGAKGPFIEVTEAE